MQYAKDTKIKWTLGLLLLCGMAIVVGTWQWKARRVSDFRNPHIAREQMRAIPVRTEVATKQMLKQTVGGTGATVPSQMAEVRLTAEARRFGFGGLDFKQVHCRQGQLVEKGQLLFELDDTLFKQAVRHRKSVVTQAEQSMVMLRELATKQAVSATELLVAERDLETARFNLAVAEANLRQCRIASPIDGVVDAMDVVRGMLLTGNPTLCTVQRLDPIFVEMDFPADQIGMLELGQAAKVEFDSFPNETHHGKIVQIAPTADRSERILPVTIEVPNPDGRLRAGITAFIRVIAEGREVTMVPKLAVVSSDRESMLFEVNQENRATIRQVQVGTVTQDNLIEIRHGITPGNRVVIFGQDKLENNDLVNDDWRGWTGRDSDPN